MPLDSDSRIDNNNLNVSLPLKNDRNGNYTTHRVSRKWSYWYWRVDVFDRLNNASNKNGIFSLEMLVNEQRVYYHDLTTFSFSESKLINLLIDYPYYKTYKRRIQKTHRVPRNTLSIYKDLKNDGKLTITEGFNYTVKIIAKDIKGNTSTLKIPIKGVSSNTIFAKTKDTTAYKIVASKFHKFTFDDVTVAFPKNSFYEDCYLDLKKENGIVQIHNPSYSFRQELYPNL